jgi:hypothetical protein
VKTDHEAISVVVEQKILDAQRGKMADEIVAGQNITTVEEGKRFARAWIVTAAQHAANEEYYRGQRDAVVDTLKEAIGMLKKIAEQRDEAISTVQKLIEMVERAWARHG